MGRLLMEVLCRMIFRQVEAVFGDGHDKGTKQ